MQPVRLLVILNPGRVSRRWMESFAAHARAMRTLGATIEVGQVWDRITRAGADHVRERQAIAREIAALCARERITHALGYVSNLSYDCGLHPDADGKPASLFVHCNVRHLMLWSDHPNWADNGRALDDPLRRLLGHRMHTHFVKSAAAAEECRRVLGWENVHHLHMGEGPSIITPARRDTPTCDGVTIMSDVSPVPAALTSLLDRPDPDPRELMRLSLASVLQQAARACPGASPVAFEAWAELKIASPNEPLFRLASKLCGPHAHTLAELQASPRQWYAAVAAMHTLTAWRRSFWTAWLARRCSVEVHGSPSEPLGIPSPAGPAWVPYERQGDIYGRGAGCFTINAAHDEEAMSHKAFQIAAAAAPCIHHTTRGLDECFAPGVEMLTFERGPELLNHLRTLAGNPAHRARLGDAARARQEQDHTWAHRLQRMIELAQADDRRTEAPPLPCVHAA